MAATALVMGAVGIDMVKAHEGLRTSAYLDPVGIPTICYGHTGPEVKIGLRYTVQRCEAILLEDLATHRKGVEKCVTAPLTGNQRDAIVSFAFNIGVTKFCASTMAKKLNRRDYIGAADELPKWVNGTYDRPQKNLQCRPIKAGYACVLPGLVKRRTAERNLFLTITPTQSGSAASDRLRAILAV